MYYCTKHNKLCGLANVFGYCSVAACTNPMAQNDVYFTGTVSDTTISKPDKIVFPHTIGNITFYSSQELIKWVEYQQEINKRRTGSWA